jgi:DNA-directed RNA polymerase specialized sigma24 family protein
MAGPLTPQDEGFLRERLTEPQAALFDDWRLFAEAWVERRYKQEGGKDKIRDFQTSLSEALIGLHYAAATYAGRGKFRNYLENVLHGRMVDLLRGETRRRQTVRIDPDAEPTDPEDGHAAGIDANELHAFDRDKGVPTQQSGEYRERFRKPRKRFRGGWSEVLFQVIRREIREAFKRGEREGRRAFGLTDEEIAVLERREKRKQQQRKRRQRQRKQCVNS